MSNSACVIIFLVLFIASLLMQFMRAKKRQRLVLRVNLDSLSVNDQEKWNSVNESFDFMFKDFRKLQIVKRNVAHLPRDFMIELDRYKFFSRLEMLVTGSMLLFAAFAYYICN